MRFKLFTILVIAGVLFAIGVFALPSIQYFNTDVQFKKGVIDSYNSTGTAGQLWSSTGTSTKWISTSTLGISLVETDPIWVAFLANPIFTNLTSTNFFATNTQFVNATTTNLYVSSKAMIGTTTNTYALNVGGYAGADRYYTSNPNSYIQADGTTGITIAGGNTTINTGYLYAATAGTSFYSQGGAVFRGGISNDTGSALTVNGGTGGITNFISKVGINSSSPVGTLGILGVNGVDPVRINSSTGSQLFAINSNGQVVVGANSLAQTGQLTIETPTTNDIALSFTNGVHYTFQLGRVAGTSGQAYIGGPSGTSLNLRSGGTDRIFIINTTGYVGVNSSSPSTQFVVVGTSTFDGLVVFGTASGTSLTSTNASFTTAGITNLTATSATSTNLYVSSLANIVQLGVNTSSPTAQLAVTGDSARDPVKVVSSTNAQLFAVKTNGQVVVGANSLAQTGQLTIETPTTNDIALSFTNGVHYTFQLGRVAGSSGQSYIGGPSGTSLNLRANGTDQVFIRTGGFVGIGSSTPAYNLTVTGTVGFANLGTDITGNGVCRTTAGRITDAGAAACVPSALKYKTSVKPYQKSATELFTDLVQAGAVQNYELKDKLGDPRKGLIADYVEKVDPNLVGYSADGSINTLHFEDITGLSVKAIAELNARITSLEEAKGVKNNTTEKVQWVIIIILGILFIKRKL